MGEHVLGRPLVRGRLAEGGAIVSGLLYFLAFAGFDVWPLTFIAFVPLYLSLFGQTAKRATWLGFLTGLAMNLGGFYWLVTMLKTFSGFPTPLCLVFVVIICAFQGGRLALMGWLHGRAVNRGWPVAPVFAAAFIASELLYPLLFPWYYAATVHSVPVLMQLADIGGPILVGVAIIAVNLAIAEPLRIKLSAPDKSIAVDKLDRKLIGVGVISLVVMVLYGVVRIKMVNATVESAEKVKVGMVQANMGLMQKRQDPGEGLRRHKRLTNELRQKGVDFVVWSETSATSAALEDSVKTNHFRDKFAGSLGVPTIFGAVLWKPDPIRDHILFNTALASNVKGDITGRYDKQYLLAFGEYLPFGETFPILYKWSPNSGKFSPGKSLDALDLDVNGTVHKVSVLICYEDILPGFTNRAVAHANPELLVNMTNDAWFGDTTEPWEHLALAKFRAIEHRRFLVRSTNSGVSAIIDPVGGILEGTLSKPFHDEAHDGVVRWLRGGTVYETLGDGPWYLVSLGIFILAFKRRKDAVSSA